MRIFHTSDTHLGHQQYPRTDAAGLNQREQDHAAAFHHVIDLAVAEKPDLFLHAGDLFDGVRPSNRALACALDGLLKLSKAGIPTVLLAGNHEHPKLRETGSPFRLFAHLPHVHPVYQGRRETVTLRLPSSGQTAHVHALPQCADNDELAAEIAAIPSQRDATDLHLLMVHGAVSTLQAFSHAEFNEQTLQPSWFDARFDFVALGHYHGVQEVVPGKAWYCGAPERVSIAEAGQEKGFLDVEVRRGHAEARFRPIPGRPYVDLPPVEARGLDAAQVVAQAKAAIARCPTGAVARQRIRGAEPSLRGALDLRALQEAGRHLLHLDLSRIEWADAQETVAGAPTLGPLSDEFEAFASKSTLPGLDRDALLRRARDLFAEAAR